MLTSKQSENIGFVLGSLQDLQKFFQWLTVEVPRQVSMDLQSDPFPTFLALHKEVCSVQNWVNALQRHHETVLPIQAMMDSIASVKTALETLRPDPRFSWARYDELYRWYHQLYQDKVSVSSNFDTIVHRLPALAPANAELTQPVRRMTFPMEADPKGRVPIHPTPTRSSSIDYNAGAKIRRREPPVIPDDVPPPPPYRPTPPQPPPGYHRYLAGSPLYGARDHPADSAAATAPAVYPDGYHPPAGHRGGYPADSAAYPHGAHPPSAYHPSAYPSAAVSNYGRPSASRTPSTPRYAAAHVPPQFAGAYQQAAVRR